MIIVIDTNALLQIFSPRSKTPEIVQALLNGELQWAVSNDVLTEYEEMVCQRSGAVRWHQVERVLQLLHLRHQSIIWTEPAFRYQVISVDRDDNKFTDCAITANADYVITNDTDFAPLANAGYRPQPITPEEFVPRHLMGNAGA
jgi:putative PIN family toxin of toxin-antitoxin system